MKVKISVLVPWIKLSEWVEEYSFSLKLLGFAGVSINGFGELVAVWVPSCDEPLCDCPGISC